MTRRARMMVVVGHPDDETIGAGGVLARRGGEGVVGVVMVTDGAPRARRWWGAPEPGSREEYARWRRAESPEWLIPWWKHFGGEGLRAVVVWSRGRMAGLAPFYVYRDTASGRRQLTLMGNGVSDHLNVLRVGGAEGEMVVRAVAAWVRRAREVEWDRCDFRDLPLDSPLLGLEPAEGVRREITAEDPCPTLRLPVEVEALGGVIPRKLMGNLRTARRRAEAMGAVTVERADERTVGGAVEALGRLHRARWAAEGADVAAFRREVADEFLARGWLRLYLLRIGGAVAAAHFGFTAGDRAFYYIGGFDPAFDRESPGSLVILHAVEEAVREGVREFDFLRGREPYKYGWGAEDREKRRLRMWEENEEWSR